MSKPDRCLFHVNSGDHNLPDSPFASPTKSAALVHDSFAATEPENTASLVGSKIDSGSNHLRPLRWKSLRPAPTSSPCAGALERPLLYFSVAPIMSVNILSSTSEMILSECNEQAVLRSRSHGDVKFSIGSE